MPDPSAARFTYRAFISYSHRDKAWADWLHKALETYRVPSRLVGTKTAHGTIPRRLNPVFRDREELSSSPELGAKINQALAQSENLIVICSPAAAASRWVNEEVLAYKRMGRAARIFCMIVEGEPNATGMPGREAEECFCPALRFATDADGRPTNERVEPIAADARPGKDGKPNAKLKLIAGMLAVGFDALKQREQRRQIRRMTAIAGIASVVMAVTIVLAIAALVSRHRAVIAQHEAVVAKQAAERRQKQAEDLVGFMLGDLTTKLRQVDRLDILNSVDDKALAYFKSLPVSDVNNTALAQRATALQKIGGVRTDQGRLPDAMEAFQQALRIDKQLVESEPKDADYKNAYGEIELWIGVNYWGQGKTDNGEDSFKKAVLALQHAAILAPKSNEIRQNLANAWANLGQIAQASDELTDARSYYTKYVKLSLQMRAKNPNSTAWQATLADAYNDTGTIALMTGHLDEAITDYARNKHLLEQAVKRDPKNRQIREQLLLIDAMLGRTLAFAGQFQTGIDYVRAAVNIGRDQTAFDPSHNDWQDSYGYYNCLLGQLLLDQGDITGASGPIATSIVTLQRLVNKDASNMRWTSNLAEAQLEGALIARARRQPGQAMRLASLASTNMQKPLAHGSSSASSTRIEAKIELLLGQLAADAGDPASASKYRKQALAHMQAPISHSKDPRNLAIIAEALLVAGRANQARTEILALEQMGYRPTRFVRLLHDHHIAYSQSSEVSLRVTKALRLLPATADLLSTHP